MDWIKWTWVLFVAVSVAILVRFFVWLLPATAIQHASDVDAAVRGIEAASESLPESPVAEVPSETSETPEAPGPRRPPASPAIPWPAADPDATDLWDSLYAEMWPLPKPAPAVEPDPPEAFHLRRIRWGMTGTEVRAAESLTPLRENAQSLTYLTTTIHLPCLLTYHFTRDRLVRAHLSFSDVAGRHLPPLSIAQAQRRFLFLREQLRQRYGEPMIHTTRVPRDVTALQRRLQKQDELTQQYDVEIAEVEERLRQQRARLNTRYERWQRREELVARGLAPYERDLRDLKKWKQEALETAKQARQDIHHHQQADARAPLVAVMIARWPFARELHDIDLRLDLRSQVPRLDIRYRAARPALDTVGVDEL